MRFGLDVRSRLSRLRVVESHISKRAVGFTVLQVPDQRSDHRTSLVSDDEGTAGSVHGWLLQGPLYPVHCDISSSIFERDWLLGWNDSKSITTLAMLFSWWITFDINNKHEPCLDLQAPDLTLTLLDWDSPSFQKCSYWEVRDLWVRTKFSLSFFLDTEALNHLSFVARFSATPNYQWPWYSCTKYKWVPRAFSRVAPCESL